MLLLARELGVALPLLGCLRLGELACRTTEIEVCGEPFCCVVMEIWGVVEWCFIDGEGVRLGSTRFEARSQRWFGRGVGVGAGVAVGVGVEDVHVA